MKVLDLFSGIGGFSLGLERAGMTTVAFCETEPFCQHLLAKHWPGVPIFDDIRNLRGANLGRIDLICGGFPCQDISVAGKGAGLNGERSGLWREYARLIKEIRPAWAIIENVPALRSRGLDQILGEVAALGYDAEWHCIPASAIGAPHKRDRVWIVANSRGGRCDRAYGGQMEQPRGAEAVCASDALAHASSTGLPGAEQPEWRKPIVTPAEIWRAASECSWRRVEPRMGGEDDGVSAGLDAGRPVEAWEGNTPRTVGRGSPNRRQRVTALGNSVVPQVVELIGRAIMRERQNARN